jgi:hypothetical protein
MPVELKSLSTAETIAADPPSRHSGVGSVVGVQEQVASLVRRHALVGPATDLERLHFELSAGVDRGVARAASRREDRKGDGCSGQEEEH